jgi:hypothetical protein
MLLEGLRARSPELLEALREPWLKDRVSGWYCAYMTWYGMAASSRKGSSGGDRSAAAVVPV